MRQKESAEAEAVGSRPSQLQMHLSRPTPSLSSTHSVLARSLMEGPRMTPEQMKRTDIIQNYIMRGDNGVRAENGVYRTAPRWPSAPSPSVSPAAPSVSPSLAVPSPVVPRLELQVDIADTPQPLNLSKKSPSPPPAPRSSPYHPRNLLLEA